MPTDVDDVALQRMEAKDSLLFALSDTQDVKASIALVVVTFLAQQTTALLSVTGPQALSPALRLVQLVAAVCLVCAGLILVLSLWPQEHKTEAAQHYDQWLRDLRETHKGAADSEKLVAHEFRAGRVQRLKERIDMHKGLTDRKAFLLGVSFGFTCLSLLLNLGTIVALALPQ